MQEEKDELEIIGELLEDAEKWKEIEQFLKDKRRVKIAQSLIRGIERTKKMKTFCRICFDGNQDYIGTSGDRPCPTCLGGEILMYLRNVESASLEEIAAKINTPIKETLESVRILAKHGEIFQIEKTGFWTIPATKYPESRIN